MRSARCARSNALENAMESLFALVGRPWGAAFALCLALGVGSAQAADFGYGRPPSAYLPPPPVYSFNVDPRCRIIPAPQLDLVGDTARFRAQALCQSRGLYADSLVFPEPPLIYRGYSYGRER
jgi:hypothetical protein